MVFQSNTSLSNETRDTCGHGLKRYTLAIRRCAAAIALLLLLAFQLRDGTRADDATQLVQNGAARPTVVFYRISQVTRNETPIYDVRFEYSFPNRKSVFLDHVGNLPSQGFQVFLSSDPHVRFRTSEDGSVIATWDCRNVIKAKQHELTEAPARQGSWVMRAQILNSLGKPAAAANALQHLHAVQNDAATQSQALAESATASLQLRNYVLAEHQYSTAATLMPEPVKASTLALAAGFAAYEAGNSSSARRLSQISASRTLPGELNKEVDSLRAITGSALHSSIPLDSPDNPINKYLGEVEVSEAFDANSISSDIRSGSWSSTKPFDELVQLLALRLFDEYPLDVSTPCPPHLCYVSKFRRFKTFSNSGNMGSLAIMISRWFQGNESGSLVYKVEYTVMQRPAGSSAPWTRASDNDVLLRAGKVIAAIADQIAGLQQ